MGTRSSDFNYKVALASGLRSLHAGRLRQAEEQFRYLLGRFPTSDGGYRGLAKVLIEEEDRPAALRMLLDGGAAVAKAGQRVAAIGLYRDATALDPHDLSAHRRLAAALTLAGDQTGAAEEYARYVHLAQISGATERARHEAEFAIERVPVTTGLATLARSLGMDVADPPPPPPPPAPTPTPAATPAPEKKVAAEKKVEAEKKVAAEDRAAVMRSAFGGPTKRDAPAAVPESPAPAPVVSATEPVEHAVTAPDLWAADGERDVEEVSDPQAVTLGGTDGERPAEDADSKAVEAAAATFLAKHDPRGGEAALEAARRYIADGRNDAASDLLLQLIASGVADHDAQRLLVDVVRTLGKRDVAKAKCQLLVQALRLDGREDLAAEVEQLALAD